MADVPEAETMNLNPGRGRRRSRAIVGDEAKMDLEAQRVEVERQLRSYMLGAASAEMRNQEQYLRSLLHLD